MTLMTHIAEITGYTVLLIAVLGICGTVAALVNDYIIRDHLNQQYADAAWSRDIPPYQTLWDQYQAATAGPDPDPSDTDAPGGEL